MCCATGVRLELRPSEHAGAVVDRHLTGVGPAGKQQDVPLHCTILPHVPARGRVPLLGYGEPTRREGP